MLIQNFQCVNGQITASLKAIPRFERRHPILAILDNPDHFPRLNLK
jgi:hypothetical protein